MPAEDVPARCLKEATCWFVLRDRPPATSLGAHARDTSRLVCSLKVLVTCAADDAEMPSVATARPTATATAATRPVLRPSREATERTASPMTSETRWADACPS